MSSEISAVDRSRDVPPWAISFSPLVTFAGCALTAVLFAGLLYLWLELVVPDGVLASDDSAARITAVVGVMGGALLLLLGPFAALGLGRLLRRSASTAAHVVTFTFAGSMVGALAGAGLGGPDVAVSLLAPLGLAAGLARLAVSPFAREKYTDA
ncbi:hypothetical protein [Actinotalea fermentans]|uniref:Uncharacterized protein n=1 Tax=Actinotalea fermentans TaxID=43671 RepID=A0A511YZG0_9CELL|nr:hypothetical protein [Actinotalea fermentans]KGM14678.1 hypothetical protein N867_17685 [Actinotalea fermentans ATCC 43279 = JCM 9966 = DSM 3133]GEN80590.1 hypothetical protein AFE02nite_23240 [Actinotalea fermentans]